MARKPNSSPRRSGSTALKSLLSGGDRRSIANSNRARNLVGASPERVAELAALAAADNDRLVSMRALDLLEKIAHQTPALVQPYKKVFLGGLAQSEQWEVRLQIVRALPLLQWTATERKRVVEVLRQNVDHPQTFVRAWALDSLATFAAADSSLMRTVKRLITEFGRSGSKALQARAKKIRARLDSDVVNAALPRRRSKSAQHPDVRVRIT